MITQLNLLHIAMEAVQRFTCQHQAAEELPACT